MRPSTFINRAFWIKSLSHEMAGGFVASVYSEMRIFVQAQGM
jgi:hypothetical protein